MQRSSVIKFEGVNELAVELINLECSSPIR